MNLSSVIDHLRREIGFAPDTLDSGALNRAVAKRMRALDLTDAGNYAQRLAADSKEMQFLLDQLAVPETWFFRGGQLFDYLAARVAETTGLLSGQKFRILSVPCSTGEEPYSLAIALAKAGVPHTTWEIDAVDLSQVHIERARIGRFSSFSFRQTDRSLRDRYFKAIPSAATTEHGRDARWELDVAIRSRVRFLQGNLLDPAIFSDERPYDLIFCRNLLIYLNADARRLVLDKLHRLLAPDGWLCTGSAEPLEFQDSRFARIGPVEYFLYCKSSAVKPRVVGVRQLEEGLVVKTLPHSPREMPIPSAAPHPTVTQADPLATARQMADSGQLESALAYCQEHVVRSGSSADWYSLMGIIQQAQGDSDEAVSSFQRALYLNPSHSEAISHLISLFQERRDDAQVQRLRRRLERVAPGGPS
jgi:chemotaxis protein methyltransferase WspC